MNSGNDSAAPAANDGPDGVNLAAKEAAIFLNEIKEGRINPRQVLIVFADANGGFGFMASEGSALDQLGLLECAKGTILSGVLAATGPMERAH